MRYCFYKSCVQFHGAEVEALNAMIHSAQQITRRTMLKHVDLRPIACELGYDAHPSQGLTMAKDWAISYYKSTFRGWPTYFFKWSAIEHIFVPCEALEQFSRQTYVPNPREDQRDRAIAIVRAQPEFPGWLGDIWITTIPLEPRAPLRSHPSRKSYTIERVPVGELVAIQPNVSRKQILELLQHGWDEPILVSRQKNRWVIEDGHHRAYAASLLGHASIAAYIVPSPNPIVEVCGDCYRYVFKMAIDYLKHGSPSPPMIIMHGWVRHPSGMLLAGQDYEHAWVERGGLVYDWQTIEYKHQAPMTVEAFYAKYQPHHVDTFTPIGLMRWTARYDHYGPFGKSWWARTMHKPRHVR